MSNTKKQAVAFTAMNLPEALARAVEEMGFETATDIQAQSIPLIRAGYDVIGRSQTGTGKTVAFGIPAIEAVDTTSENRNQVQVLILCPTRELAVQACGELKKLSSFLRGIHPVEVYGGAPMDRQIVKLKKANIVVGTPGRIMDHMRRRTLKLNHVKMVVLDEADEMLSMGFREDIETILKDTPAQRQTILFSATMPPAILRLTKEYQREPQMVEIDRERVTVSRIAQYCYEVPMGRKTDALNLLLRYYLPKRAIVFCNTKKMVDDIGEYLTQNKFSAECLHGDMKQSQRTKVMDGFKQGKTQILIATDVAARGIDVNDVDVVINYDIPQSAEYYVHRIGRTGRAGKKGRAITICSGRRQKQSLFEIGRETKSNIEQKLLPNIKAILSRKTEQTAAEIEELMNGGISSSYDFLVERLEQKGFSAHRIAAALMELHYGSMDSDAELEKLLIPPTVFGGRKEMSGGRYGKISIDIGRDAHVAPNHLVGAIAERTALSGKEIGKIEVYDDHSVIAIPIEAMDEVVERMQGCKICGIPVLTAKMATKSAQTASRRAPRNHGGCGARGSGKKRQKNRKN